MSGIRLYSFREGDRSEYLANYLLSGLGLVTVVPRQEDIGFDFYCQLADQESGNLTFGFPFIVQVKSDSTDEIVYGSAIQSKWKAEHIDWLKRLELPFLIGVVDKRKMKIDIYNCSALRFVFIENPNPSVIELRIKKTSEESKIGKPSTSDLQNWIGSNNGDGKRHIVDIGHPIVTITNEDIYDIDLLALKKKILRSIIVMEQKNILYTKLTLPHFHWTLDIKTNEDFQPAWYYGLSEDPEVLRNHYRTLGPGLLSLAINLRVQNQEELLKNIIPLLRELPDDIIPQEIKALNPDFFEDVKVQDPAQ